MLTNKHIVLQHNYFLISKPLKLVSVIRAVSLFLLVTMENIYEKLSLIPPATVLYKE
jgi:hypothetical protein